MIRWNSSCRHRWWPWYCARLMWGIDHALPVGRVQAEVQGLLALVLVCLGIGVSVSGMLAFRAARTTVDPRNPGKATQLVAGGVYRLSRNPMYVGLLCTITAWAVYLGSPWGLPAPAALRVVCHALPDPARRGRIAPAVRCELYGLLCTGAALDLNRRLRAEKRTWQDGVNSVRAWGSSWRLPDRRWAWAISGDFPPRLQAMAVPRTCWSTWCWHSVWRIRRLLRS